MVTLKDVARETGFSIKTISRVVNQEKGVSPATQQIIGEAINRLGYTPHFQAMSLKSGRSRLVGVITGPLGLSVKTRKLFAIQRGLEREGIKSLLSCTDLSKAGGEEELLPFLGAIDGVICLNPPGENGYVPLLEKWGKAVLYVDGRSVHFPSIEIDRERGVLDAFSQLQSQYHRFIYFNGMGGKEEDSRLLGFRKFIDHLGDNKSGVVINGVKNDYTGGYHLGLEYDFCERKGQRTLVLCTNDQMAFGLLKSLYERKISVPESVGVLGFDGDDYGRFGYKSLATISQPVEEMGKLAVEILLNMLSGAKYGMRYTVQTEFTAGESA